MQGNSNNNNFLQLQISQLCNETTHDKVAPTKQNLICHGKSAIEVRDNSTIPRDTNIAENPGQKQNCFCWFPS